MMNTYPHFMLSLMICLAVPSVAPTDHQSDNVVGASGSAQSTGAADGNPVKGGDPAAEDFGDFDSEAIYEPAQIIEDTEHANEDSDDPGDDGETSAPGTGIDKVQAGEQPDTKKAPPSVAPVKAKISKSDSVRPGPARVGMKLKLHNQRSRTVRLSVDSSVAIDLEKKIDLAQVANPEVADILVPSVNRVIVVGKTVGSTQLLLRTGEDYASFLLTVTPNYATLRQMIRAVAPSSDVSVGSLKGQTILMGRVPDALTSQRIEELAAVFQGGEVINHMSVSGVQQVLLHVVVAEVSKDATRTLGINWGHGASRLSRDFFFANNLGQLNPTTFGSGGLADVRQGQQLFSLAPNANGSSVNFTFGFPRAELQFFLNALRENNLARTLAEPNLIAISGQTAAFLAGGEVPIPVAQGGAVAGAITIEYKEFGVRLAFTPTVGAGGVIRIHVMTEVSDAIPDTRQVGGLPLFSFVTRRVESTIESAGGQTFAIAGLLSDRINAISSKIPGIGDIPVLGALFSSVDYQKSRTELVVLVTPQLVEALDPAQVVPPPGALSTDPTDLELFTLQKLEGTPRAVEDTEWAASAAQEHKEGAEEKSSAKLAGSGLLGPWGIEDPEGNVSGN